MDRAFSDSLVITDGDLCESLEELREQVRQLSMLNGLLTDDLKAVEGELALYKERLLRERRQHPVPVFTSAPDVSNGSGNQSKNGSRQSSRSATPQLVVDAGIDTDIDAGIDCAALRLALEASNVAVMPSSTLSLHKTLGTGCFGQTVLGMFGGVMCAVKKVDLHKPDTERQFVREVEALQKVRHPHVISLWGVVVEPGACWLVTEFMPNGTLNDAIRRTSALKGKPMSTRMQILWDISSGLSAMERIGVLHRDLKPSNVLLDGNLRAKVADMGLARIVNDEHVALTPETGTYLYMAPEVMNGESYGTPADVWSWACLAVEVISSEYPYQRRLLTPLQIANEVTKLKLRPDLPEGLGHRMTGLLQRCFSFDPSERPGFGRITKEMELVYAEERAKEGVANGMRRSGSWMGFFARESGSGKLGRLSGSSLPPLSASNHSSLSYET